MGTTTRGGKVAHCLSGFQYPALDALNGPSAGRVARAAIFARYLPSQPYEDLNIIFFTYPKDSIPGGRQSRLLPPLAQFCAATL